MLLLIVAVPMLSVGRSTSRHTITHSGSKSLIGGKADAAMVATDDTSFTRSDDAPLVRTVAHRADEVEAEGETSDESVQFAAPMKLEGISVPSNSEFATGLTLEAIEQMALANNPAIQQASAAAARASGIRNQVGLKPNPTIGYNGAQLADAATDQHSLFIEQTFVRGDKLAWNRQAIGHDVNAMNWLVETQRQRLRTDIRLAFYEALAAQKRLGLSREFRTVAEKGVTFSDERIKADVGTKPDVLQSEIQLNEVDLAIHSSTDDSRRRHPRTCWTSGRTAILQGLGANVCNDARKLPGFFA